MIEDIIKQVRKAAMELNMEVDEFLEWLRAETTKNYHGRNKEKKQKWIC